MFKFGFSEEKTEGEKSAEEALNWYPSRIIEPTEDLIDRKLDPEVVTNVEIADLTIKLMKSEDLILNLKNENCENVVRAESQHSDLLPAVYEGGLKVWECSYDLIKFLLGSKVTLEDSKVLDLGCGSGVVGIAALLKGSSVHFQDYNSEVIESFTIPNVLLNVSKESMKSRCEFYSGDWEDFTSLIGKKNQTDDKYDVIVTSETIYNENNQEKLFNVFREHLKSDGVGFVAGKTCYFGVGGGMRQFEQLIKKHSDFEVENVWKSAEGVQREIIKLTRKL